MAEKITIRGAAISLDLLLWRRYGVRGRELVVSTLEANPDLADLGPIIPLGTVINIPDLSVNIPTSRKLVTLFG